MVWGIYPLNMQKQTPWLFKRYTSNSKLCIYSRFSLVVIENAAENSYVKDRMGADKWIGITDKDQEGNYVTVHGSTVPWKLYATGEPNNCCGGTF